jgi:hypothetical protein
METHNIKIKNIIYLWEKIEGVNDLEDKEKLNIILDKLTPVISIIRDILTKIRQGRDLDVNDKRMLEFYINLDDKENKVYEYLLNKTTPKVPIITSDVFSKGGSKKQGKKQGKNYMKGGSQVSLKNLVMLYKHINSVELRNYLDNIFRIYANPQFITNILQILNSSNPELNTNQQNYLNTLINLTDEESQQINRIIEEDSRQINLTAQRNAVLDNYPGNNSYSEYEETQETQELDSFDFNPEDIMPLEDGNRKGGKRSMKKGMKRSMKKNMKRSMKRSMKRRVKM